MAKSMRQSTLPGMEPDSSPTKTRAAKTSATKAPRASVSAPPEGDDTQRELEQAAVRARQVPHRLKGETVWVVDANSLIFQVFHALPEMTSPQGEPVSAVFGFTRDMLYLLEEKKPTYLFVAFDASERTFRHELY